MFLLTDPSQTHVRIHELQIARGDYKVAGELLWVIHGICHGHDVYGSSVVLADSGMFLSSRVMALLVMSSGSPPSIRQILLVRGPEDRAFRRYEMPVDGILAQSCLSIPNSGEMFRLV